MSSRPLVINTNLRIAGFAIWAALLAFLAALDLCTVTKPILWSVALAFISLSLEAFLLFKMTHYIPFTSYRTTRWHAFFYADRRGSMALLSLCAAWMVALLAVAAMVFLDLVVSGPVSAALGRLYKGGGALMVLADGICVFTVFDLLFLMAWVFWTGARALWRVTAPPGRREDEEGDAGVGLMTRHGS